MYTYHQEDEVEEKVEEILHISRVADMRLNELSINVSLGIRIHSSLLPYTCDNENKIRQTLQHERKSFVFPFCGRKKCDSAFSYRGRGVTP